MTLSPSPVNFAGFLVTMAGSATAIVGGFAAWATSRLPLFLAQMATPISEHVGNAAPYGVLIAVGGIGIQCLTAILADRQKAREADRDKLKTEQAIEIQQLKVVQAHDAEDRERIAAQLTKAKIAQEVSDLRRDEERADLRKMVTLLTAQLDQVRAEAAVAADQLRDDLKFAREHRHEFANTTQAQIAQIQNEQHELAVKIEEQGSHSGTFLVAPPDPAG